MIHWFSVFRDARTDGRVGLRVTNTLVDLEPPLILDMEVIDPERPGDPNMDHSQYR